MTNMFNLVVNKQNLERLLTRLPPGRARHRYEKMLIAKFCTPLRGVLCKPPSGEKPVAEAQENGPEIFNLEAELDKGPIQAVQIYSKVLGADIWLVFERDFLPHDGLAIFYPDEITKMGTKTIEDLLVIHKAKLVFPGCRIIQ